MRPRTAGLLLAAVGCAPLHTPLPEGAYITAPTPPPSLPTPTPADPLPPAPAVPPRDPNTPLALDEVLQSVLTHFPLLVAVEQERAIAAGNRLAAEGGFDPLAKLGGNDQSGTFSNGRLNASVEQASPFGGATTFAGWRWGNGNFPIYYGDRKTAEGGEFRAGVTLPLLQNRDIDPRRARLRAAQIAERLADPAVRRERLLYLRTSAQAYWAWQAAGGQYLVAAELLRLAKDRQAVFDARQVAGNLAETVAAQNRRQVAEREEAVLAAERAVQAAAVRLSLFLRDAAGDPVIPAPTALLAKVEAVPTPAPDPTALQADVDAAYTRRPELVRFQLEKERRAVELALAVNQQSPQLNLTAAAAQDVGFSKKTFTGTGPFTTDRTMADVGLALEAPLPFRSARGLTRVAQAQLSQLLAQERFTRDDIAAQVQDAASELTQTHKRLEAARREQAQADRVVTLETVRYANGDITLVELNLQELAAAAARGKVVSLVGLYHQAVAAYRAAVGLDPADPPAALGVLP